MPAGLIALALGGFGIGLTEFVIAGLLPEVAADFHVDEATAGWLISGYALAVVVGALGLTAAATRIPRKAALLGLMVLFIVGNLLSAIAPDYGVMLAGRILAALCHGAFFGIGSVVAAGLVAPEKQARAIAVMFTGLTAANVLGVPFGTLLGQAFGWRSTFWAITVIGVAAIIGVALLVPRDAGDRPTAGLRGELSAFRSGQVWLSLAATVLGFGGMFGAFTYIAYTLTGVSGFPSSAVPWLLILFGLGLFAGNWVGGRLADRSIDGTLLWLLGALAVVLVGFALVAGIPVGAVIALVLMGAFGFATVPALQLRVLSYASHAPTLASGGNIAAFNLGNALGAWLGGLTIAAGLGYTSPLWVGAAMTVGALVVIAIAAAASRRRSSRDERAEIATSDASLPF
ncbi:MFS transporter, DHA1 family, arabinose polymer transporter [Leifsonia sp. 98AMF]|uniref:MFS transporter n=1 Tax=unclassified Leifsonia TaxID=2663824 RepID=UPI00087A3FE4|nr:MULTISPECIES: MFS transporter [unclassified Leifsonia]SDH00532.1 MFS transporter, DHA1 family, arabinose polymer transporter [Leifsonia sp. 197AMF]SDJ40886.1 MFS transporter, DHA1 family, arabinose polymer transporter [Leifsonia sp. 466MF]SDK36599.1 MFS transporter, DHA1 family, arabinose polymer transporter [Leifsonia sp. 157MF]SDN61212.1 MFS transporter, DHA1 family, arabinose polymer transporter [Leifsonia sp. 509MF]SEN47843.1 MFS transporter, DHA1 family, arabinose polymer transporter [